MKGAKRFFINGFILATATVLMRAISVSFNAFVTKVLGEEAVGLFTLVMSVYSLAIVFATSSVNLATVRLTSAALAKLEAENAGESEIKRVLRKEIGGCIKYSLFFSLLTSAVVFILAELIGTRILGDARTVLSVRVLSVSLPFISVGSAVSGYFTGVRKAYKNALISAIEQFIKIILITAGLVIIAPKGIEYACVAVVGGGAAGEALSIISDVAFYFTDKIRSNGHNKHSDEKRSALWRAAEIAFPVALGSYVRQSLVCAEHIAIPSSLRKSGANSSDALASYGVLHGMVFPLIFFPSSLLNSFSSLLVPEITACVATNDRPKAKRIAERVIKTCLIFSFAVSGAFVSFSSEFGLSVYNSSEAGKYIAMIAPLIPVMYLDTSVDFVLKGLGEQVYTMGVNILDATLSLALVLILVPRFGLVGYIASVYLVELVNCALSLGRLIYVTDLKVKISWIIKPLISIMISCFTSRFLFSLSFITDIGYGIQLAFTFSLMIFFMRITGAITKSDVEYMKNTVKNS